MTSGAFTAPFEDAAPWFERRTGHDVVSVFGASTGGAPDSIPTRLARGERADVVIVSAQALDALVAAGEVEPGTRRDLVLSRIGMAVRAGAPKPDISSVDALVRTLREARSIAYSASVSGTYLATELFPRLGLADEIAAKGRRIESERVGAVVARGDAEIGFQQISELVTIEGIDYVGPLPDEVQRVSTFSAGIAAGAASPAAARELVAFLASAALGPVVERYGLDQIGYEQRDWRPLFNGRDLTGWTPKIRRHDARRQLRRHVSRARRVARGRLRRLRHVRRAVRPPLLRGAVLALSAAHRVPLRRRASAGRAGLGRAQQRRHGALASARDDAARPGLSDLDRGAVPRGLQRRQRAADRQRLLAGHAHRLRRRARHDALHSSRRRRRSTATRG